MKKILYFAIFTALFGAQIFNFSVGPFQMSLFRMAIIVALILFIGQGIWGNQTAILIPAGKNHYSIQFFLIWFLYAIISLAWAHDANNWFRNVYFLGIGVFTTVLFSNYFTEEDIIFAIHIFNWSIFLQSIFGWYEIITRNYLFRDMAGKNLEWYVYGPERIPIAMQGNPNDFATVMFTGIVIAVICMNTSGKKIFQVFYCICIVNYICLILKSISRANIIAVILAFAFLLFTSRKKGFLCLVLAIAAILIFPKTVSFLQDTLQFHFNTGSGSDVVRLNLIKNGFHYLIDTFGFGVGAGQIEYWMKHYATGYIGDITNMHNWWMEILTGYGVFIFAGYIVFYVRLFLNLYRTYRTQTKSKTKRKLSLAICCWMIGFVVSSVSASSNITCEWFWIIWGLLIAYQGLNEKKEVYLQV